MANATTPTYEGSDRRETIVPPASNVKYIVAVMFMMFLGVVSTVVLVTMKPDNKDNILVIGTIIGFLAPTTLSLLALMKSQDTHLSVNSRLDAFMSQARLASRAEGLSEGRKEGREQANQRTDELAATASGAIQLPVIPLALSVHDPLVSIEKNTKEAAETLKEIKDK